MDWKSIYDMLTIMSIVEMDEELLFRLPSSRKIPIDGKELGVIEKLPVTNPLVVYTVVIKL